MTDLSTHQQLEINLKALADLKHEKVYRHEIKQDVMDLNRTVKSLYENNELISIGLFFKFATLNGHLPIVAKIEEFLFASHEPQNLYKDKLLLINYTSNYFQNHTYSQFNKIVEEALERKGYIKECFHFGSKDVRQVFLAVRDIFFKDDMPLGNFIDLLCNEFETYASNHEPKNKIEIKKDGVHISGSLKPGIVGQIVRIGSSNKYYECVATMENKKFPNQIDAILKIHEEATMLTSGCTDSVINDVISDCNFEMGCEILPLFAINIIECNVVKHPIESLFDEYGINNEQTQSKLKELLLSGIIKLN